MNKLSASLSGKSDLVAKRLLGCYLIRTIGTKQIIAKIVETEAYDQSDPASHSFKGPTPRNAVMFGPAGYLYVYFTYGLHYCMNIVTGPIGHGSAVLIRAVEPVSGLELIKANRPNVSHDGMLTNGPAKVCQALAIGRQFNGHDLSQKPVNLVLKPPIKTSEIVSSSRIGITQATDLKWRFYLRNNAHVSKSKSVEKSIEF